MTTDHLAELRASIANPLPGETALALAERRAGIEMLLAGRDTEAFLKATSRWIQAQRRLRTGAL